MQCRGEAARLGHLPRCATGKAKDRGCYQTPAQDLQVLINGLTGLAEYTGIRELLDKTDMLEVADGRSEVVA